MIKQLAILLVFLLLGDIFIGVFCYGIGGDSDYTAYASILLGGVWGCWVAHKALTSGAFSG